MGGVEDMWESSTRNREKSLPDFQGCASVEKISRLKEEKRERPWQISEPRTVGFGRRIGSEAESQCVESV